MIGPNTCGGGYRRIHIVFKLFAKTITGTFDFVFMTQGFRSLVAGTWTETKKMYHGGFFLKLADDDV